MVMNKTRTRALLPLVALGALLMTTTAAQAVDFSAAQVYREASDSVVLIFGFNDSASGGSTGTGSVISSEGHVLTNNHVIYDSATGKPFNNIVVYFKPDEITGDNRKDLTRPYRAQVVARDQSVDLAVLKLGEVPSDLHPIQFGDSREVEIGESVAAIGHPGGGGLWTLTTGTVSSKRKDNGRDVFQTDTAINPGNSGGPLLDANARLVGINTFIRRKNNEGLALEGLSYSLRSSLAMDWVNGQGVTRVASVSRGSNLASAAAPAEPKPQAQPAPKAEPEPMKPEPMAKPAPSPEPQASPAAEPKSEPRSNEPREFTGPRGEKMYGTPDRDYDPQVTRSFVYSSPGYKALAGRAKKGINKLDNEMDDYEDF